MGTRVKDWYLRDLPQYRARQSEGGRTGAMFTVALIGPDGAGKTTIGRRLEQTLPLPVRYVYMGINYEASNHVLPTTRLIRAARRARGVGPDTAGPRDPERLRPRPKGLVKRVAHGLKSSLSLANRIAEEAFRHSTGISTLITTRMILPPAGGTPLLGAKSRRPTPRLRRPRLSGGPLLDLAGVDRWAAASTASCWSGCIRSPIS